MNNNNQIERVPDEELDQMIWKLERDGMTPKQLSLMRELREVRRSKGEPVSAITPHFDTIALETATEIMCDVNRRNEFLGGDVQLLSRIQCRIDDACRAAMLNHSGNSEQPEPVSNRDELPMQPLLIDAHGTLRFKENPIVRKLLDYATKRGYGLNEMAMEPFDEEDRMQLAQLIGYSLSGYGSLSYVTDESYERAASSAAPKEVKGE